MGTLYRRKPRGNWHAAFTGTDGSRVQRSTGTANKQIANEILKKWEEDANANRYGIRATTNNLSTLVDEYIAYLGNSDPSYINYARSSLNRIFSANDWTKASQITQYQVETTVRQFVDLRTGKKIGLRTQAHYLGSAKSFTRWLRLVRKAIAVDPLEAVRKPSPSKDRRRIRRFLLPGEWPWLAKTPNALLYETAIQTGLRSSEIRLLQPKHLFQDHVELPAADTKNKEIAKQFITKSLAERLRGNLPFQFVNDARLAETIAKDLGIARFFANNDSPQSPDFLAYIDARGHYLDFHALRHTCGAWLALSGVQPKTIQAVMRHSSITLTLDTYGHLLPGAEQDAVQHFDRIMSANMSQDVAR